MNICDNFSITLRARDEAFIGVKNKTAYTIEKTDPAWPTWKSYYDAIRAYRGSRAQESQKWFDDGKYQEILGDVLVKGGRPNSTSGSINASMKDSLKTLTDSMKRLMDFFTEFSFAPSFRFTNTLAFAANVSKEAAKRYIKNYFALMDSSYKNEISAKLSSQEFTQILDGIRQYGTPKERVNKRLKIYYGSAGTGKTTLAQTESENRCIVCNSSMLPSDLMEDFIFKDGNPDFNPSILWNCMEEGKTIVLDEINLLPFDSLRFLQGIVDGKTEFIYKNRTVHISEGFQIIGTMNLSLGGMIYGLPEPLVDRCCEAREFTLTAEQLAKAITGN